MKRLTVVSQPSYHEKFAWVLAEKKYVAVFSSIANTNLPKMLL